MELKTNLSEIINELTNDLVESVVLLVELEMNEEYEKAAIVNDMIDSTINTHAEYFDLTMLGKKDNFIILMGKQKQMVIKKIKENIRLFEE